MENIQARSLIRDTFTQPFDKARFKNFIANVLNEIDENKAARWTKTYVKEAFRPRVKWFERLGTYTDPNGEKVDVLVVYLERQSSLERARTSLRNFVADYLTTGHGQDKAAVLAAFVSPDESDWRFSFVKLEYESAPDASGRVKVTETLTPARRHSFLVGSNEHSHTAQKQFLPLLELDDARPSLEEVEKAFDIEKVTKEFFERYKGLFESVRDALEKILKRNAAVKEDFEKKGIETDDFAKKLLGQIVFLYFLQKKGWFGVERGTEWGTGNKQFLRHLFENRTKLRARQDRSADRPVNFFNDVLEHLFYDALARERDDDYYARFDCRIPFLNGGLFEPLFGYDWVNTEIFLPDKLFSNTETTKDGDRGTGILDVFDRYNFTVNESEPLEKEVAVDPEMLGKVFENLLPENLRHKGGTYYTPRPIVNYMCQQSLINYLSTNLSETPRDDIERFIRIGYAQADFEASGVGKHKPKFLDESISRDAKTIDKLLAEITVCDPAIGSGAFPVGMMQEIVRAREALSKVEGMPERTVYELKRHTIQTSLYGVDIDPGAVEIAKLRLWLSLVVDEDDRHSIQALPNLDYKIMQGNSLLDEFAGVKLLDEELIAQAFVDRDAQLAMINSRINELQDQFFELDRKGARNREMKQRFVKEIEALKRQKKQITGGNGAGSSQASFQDLQSIARTKLAELKKLHSELFDTLSSNRKHAIRQRLDNLEWEFMEAALKENGNEKALREFSRHRADNRKNYFLWKLQFVDVFQEKGGFDVVIANPPYVRIQTLNETAPDQVEYFKRRYVSARKGSYDLYVVFVERGLELLQPRGHFAYILPHKFFNAKYGEALRELLVNGKHLQHIVHFGDQQVFPEATNYVCLLFLAKTSVDNFRFVRVDDLDQWLSTFQGTEGTITAEQASTSEWNFAVGRSASLFEKLHRMPVKLRDIAEHISQGIRTSANEVYVLDVVAVKSGLIRAWSKQLENQVEIEQKAVIKFLQGREIKAYAISPSGKVVLMPYTLRKGRMILRSAKDYRDSMPKAWEYLYSNKKYLQSRENGKMKHDAWYGFVYPKNLDVMFASKLVVPDISDRAAFAFDSSGEFAFTSGYGITFKSGFKLSPKFVLGVLNSSLLDWYWKRISTPLRGGFFRYFTQFIEQLPIREIDLENKEERAEHDAVVRLVDRILAAKGANPSAATNALERQIDERVYNLYKLTRNEIAIVEDAVKNH